MPRPLVTLHFAQSLDGRIGLGRGRERAVLSSEEGTLRAHQARSQHDAVLVGIETLLEDDPLLSVRGPAYDAARPQPLRVVLDSKLRTPLDSRLLHAASQAGPVLVFGCAGRASAARQRELEGRGASTLLVSADPNGWVSLAAVVAELYERGARRLLVEGGATVVTSFLRARLADRAQIEIAPYLLGGPATPALRELGTRGMAGALRLSEPKVEQLGQSVFVQGDILYPAAGPDDEAA